MPGDKEYHLYVQRHLKVFIFGILTLFTVSGFLMISGVLQSSNGNGPPRLVGLFWLIMVSWYWYWVLTIPHTIMVSESGRVAFNSVIRKRLTTMREINSIKPYGNQFGFLQIKTNTGKIRLLNQFDGFHDFLLNLKTANPTVEIRGC